MMNTNKMIMIGVGVAILGLIVTFLASVELEPEQARYDRLKTLCIDSKAFWVKTYSEYETKALNDGDREMWKANHLNALDELKQAKTIPASKDYVCGKIKTRVEHRARHSVYMPQSAAELRAQAERNNAEIDKGLNSVLDDYKKNARSHITSVPGAGIRVDVFEMKDGNIHTCRTSIKNNAKAVDCN